MSTAQALVQTDRPERYLAQICKHAARMGGGGGHRLRMHKGSPATHELDVSAEWSDAQGALVFTPGGTCALTADGSTLTLRIEATDGESLQRIQGILTRDLDRFGRREGLVVDWQAVQD